MSAAMDSLRCHAGVAPGLLLAALLAPSVAASATLEGGAQTHVFARDEVSHLANDGRVDARERRAFPLYERVWLSGTGVRALDADVEVQASGWGVVDPAGVREDGAGGDLDLGFVDARFGERALSLRAGRQLVFQGAARAFHLDGLRADAAAGPLSLSAFGGWAVASRFSVDAGDWAVGGRAGGAMGPVAGGVSYFHLSSGGLPMRRLVGVDLSATPTLATALVAHAFVDPFHAGGLAELRTQAFWQPGRWALTADVDRIRPDLLLPRESIFTVFADEAARTEVGGRVSRQIAERIEADVAYHRIVYPGGEGGNRFEGEVRSGWGGTTYGIEAERLDAPVSGYWLGRVFGRAPIVPRWIASADLGLYRFHEEINGARVSLLGSAGLGYELARDWRAALIAYAGTTALEERVLFGQAVVEYRFGGRTFREER